MAEDDHNIQMIRCDVTGLRCRSLFQSGVASRRVTTDAPDAVICTSKYSRGLPYTMGSSVFPVTNDRSDYSQFWQLAVRF